MTLSPIVVFTYNRPEHTRLTIEALLNNEFASQSDLIVYSDGWKDEITKQSILATRKYLHAITGFKSLKVIERNENFGLGNNIIDGVTTTLMSYDRIIVLEDDLITSPFFLKYMNEGLNEYEKEDDVISIHGYVYPMKKKLPDTFFIKGADCLGWGTWKRGWNLFEKDGSILLDKITKEKKHSEFDFNGSYPYSKTLEKQVGGITNSWAIRWYASAFINNKLTLYPRQSLIFHNGSDGSGTNCGISDEFKVTLSQEPLTVGNIDIVENKKARKAFIHYFRYTRQLMKLKSHLKRILHIK